MKIHDGLKAREREREKRGREGKREREKSLRTLTFQMVHLRARLSGCRGAIVKIKCFAHKNLQTSNPAQKCLEGINGLILKKSYMYPYQTLA